MLDVDGRKKIQAPMIKMLVIVHASSVRASLDTSCYMDYAGCDRMKPAA